MSIAKPLIRFLLTLTFIFITPAASFPQAYQNADNNRSLEDVNYGLYFTPQTLIKHGIRMDFEWFFKYPRHSIVASPLYYQGTLSNESTPIDETEKVKGFGLSLTHKYYLTETMFHKVPSKFYVGHGPYFRKYNIRFKAYEWQLVKEGGLEIYQYNKADQKRTITKWGYSLMLGSTAMPLKHILVDYYAGVGFRGVQTTTTLAENVNNQRAYKRNFFDYGYEGPVLLLGVKLGVLF